MSPEVRKLHLQNCMSVQKYIILVSEPGNLYFAVEPNRVPVHSVPYTNKVLSVTQENADDLAQRG